MKAFYLPLLFLSVMYFQFPKEIFLFLFVWTVMTIIYTTNFRKHSKLWKIFMGYSPYLKNRPSLS